MRWAYQSAQAFFGLEASYRENILEETFILAQNLYMSYETVMRMPVRYRRWFIDRLIKQKTPKPTSAMDDMDKPLSELMKANN